MAGKLSIIWLHAIWSTKDRKRVLTKDFRFKLFSHVKTYASLNNINVDIINGVEDHVHCLLRLKSTQNPAEVIKVIKGESSYWVNNNVILDEPFEWQKGYGIFSLSYNEVLKVRQYIYNQEEHHKNNTYLDELDKLIPKNLRD